MGYRAHLRAHALCDRDVDADRGAILGEQEFTCHNGF
jgi:hypothetical protein